MSETLTKSEFDALGLSEIGSYDDYDGDVPRLYETVGLWAWEQLGYDGRRESRWHGLDGWPACACSGCDCQLPATTTDDGGEYICGECTDYCIDEGGAVICAKMTESFAQCHVCGEEINWGGICTDGGPGAANYRVGRCKCGPVWKDEDRGGWSSYGYHPED